MLDLLDPLLCHCPWGTHPITLHLKGPLRLTQTISSCSNLPTKEDIDWMITEDHSSRDAGEPDQRRQNTIEKKTRHPFPSGQSSVPNKVRTKSLHLFKMQMIWSHQSGVYLVRAHYLPTVWQIGTCEEGLYGAATLFILWRATCKRKEAVQLTHMMVDPDYTHTLC